MTDVFAYLILGILLLFFVVLPVLLGGAIFVGIVMAALSPFIKMFQRN